MKHALKMLIGCALPLLLIFQLTAFAVEGDWVLALAIVAMFACHLMHFGAHKHGDHGEHDHDLRH